MNKPSGKIAPFSERSSRPLLVSEANGNPTALVVLGMHRSGTSALTRVLSLSGYALPATLMDPSSDNSEGFWESRPIADLNDSLLGLVGSYWDDPFGFSPDSRITGLLAGQKERAIRLVRDQFPGMTPIVLKDPRIAVVFEFWREVLTEAGYTVSPVIAVRHPIEVAASLSKRDEFPASKSLLIWLSYQLAAERATRDLPRAIVMYDDLMTDWRSCLDRLEKSLNISLGRRDPEAELLIERFLKPDLRHHTADDNRESTRRNLPSWIGATYDWFKSAATGVEADPSALVAPTEEYVRQRRWFGPIVADLRLEALAMRRLADEEIRKADARFLAADAAYKAEIDTRDLELRRQNEALVEADNAAQALQRSTSILDQRLREAERSASQRIAELEAQVLEIERVRAQQHEQHDHETAQLNLRLGEASEAQRRALAETAALDQRLREAERSASQRIAELEAQVLEIERVRAQQHEQHDHETAQLNLRLGEASEAQRRALAETAALDQRLREAERSASQRIAELEAQVLEIERVRAQQHEQHDHETAQLNLRLGEASEAQRRALAETAALDQRLREAERSASQRIAELEAQVLEIERVRAQQHEQHDHETAQLNLRLGEASEAQRRALAKTAALDQRLREAERSASQRIAELEAQVVFEAQQRLQEVAAAQHASHIQVAALQAKLDRRISDQIAEHRESSATIVAAYEAERDRRENEVRAESRNAQDVISSLQSDLSRTQGIARERGQLLDRLIRENHEMRSSTLWRVMSPARWLGSKVPLLSRGSRLLRSAVKRGVRGPVSNYAQTASQPGATDDRIRRTTSSDTSSRKSLDPEPIARYLVTEHGEQEDADVWRRHCLNFPLPIDPASDAKPNLEFSDSEAEDWIRRCAAEGARLLPLNGAPHVSIVIPVYNQLAFTLSAIASIYAHKTKHSYEILVGDDGSSDQTRHLDDLTLPRVRLVRHESNVGFLLNCNLTAEKAQGEFIVFLNNDTVVLPGWLDELVDTLKSNKDVGLVGSKLLYANATLQEAGGIVWQDGSAWNWGRNQDPRDPRYCYAREADYCSGASIAISAGLWRELGGFDGVTFENSYYEDVDLAFRVREAGLKVMYQPLSSIVHFEGITSGVDVKGGAKKYQVSNGARFFARWRQTLKAHRPNAVEPVKESERHVMGRLLVIDAVTPTPDRDAGSLVMMEMISAFQDSGWRVSFIPEDNFAHLPVVTHRLQREGIEALYWPHFQSVDEILEKRGKEFDIVVISRVGPAAKHLNVVRTRAPHAKIIFNTVDLHFLREQREAKLSGGADAFQKAAKTEALELQAVSDADLTIVHSTVERDILERERPEAKIAVFPWVSTVVAPSVPPSSRDSILFVGSFQHAPNADGLRWFLDAIWPRVRAQVQDARFNIVGAEPPADIQGWHGRDGVNVLGWVQDLDPQLNRARVSVAPLRFGAGVKGKVVSALSRGLPVVCTSIASEGMGLRSGVDVVVADDPEEFARAIVTLLSDESAWLQLSRSGLCFVEDNYSHEAARNRVKAMVNQVGL